DAANGNYTLDAASLAVDSSQNTEQDRFDFRNFKATLGIPASPIVAPDRDIFGQLRVDSNAGPGGGGAEIFKDRGATDRSDSENPVAILLNPVDNDSQDRDPAATIVLRNDPILENFTILLSDATGVDSLTVDDPNDPAISAQAIRIEENGVPLVQNVDYVVGYNELTGILLLTPTSTLWNQTSVFTIELDNTLIADRVGNRLRPNQTDGSTRFTVVMPEAPLDYGDAPDSYQTRLADDGARHAFAVLNSPQLGTIADREDDGQPSVDADGDDLSGNDDEGGLPVGEFVGTVTTEGIFVSDPTGSTSDPGSVIAFLNRNDAAGSVIPITALGDGVVDGWIDFNADGDFNDSGEHVVQGVAVTDGVNMVTVITPDTATLGQTYARFRISPNGVDGPNGLAIGGEVEDYRVGIFHVDEPVVNPDSYEVAEDQVLTVDGSAGRLSLFDNDVLPDGQPNSEFVRSQYTIDGTLVSGSTDTFRTANGTVRIDDPVAGLFTYTPDPDFYGDDSFRYLVTTQQNGSVAYASTATIRVTPVNDAPGVSNEFLRTIEDIDEEDLVNGGFVITAADLLANAVPDADPMTALVPQDESNQQVFVQSITTVVNGNSATLDASNPTAEIDTIRGGKLSATFDIDGNIVSLLYRPARDFNSENLPPMLGDFLDDEFIFTVTDDGISLPVDGAPATAATPLTAQATAFIRVTPQNDAPVLETDDVAIASADYVDFYTNLGLTPVVPTEDQTLVIPSEFLLQNDHQGPLLAADERAEFSGNDGPLRIIDVSLVDPTLGQSISVDPITGEITFVPADDVFGEVFFTYTVEDQGIDQAAPLDAMGDPAPKLPAPLTTTITARIFLEPVNDVPVAVEREFNVDEVVETRAPDPPVAPAQIVISRDALLNGTGDVLNPGVVALASDVTLAAPYDESNQNLEVSAITVEGVTATSNATLITASGGTLEVEFDANGFLIQAIYTPPVDYNSNTPFFVPEDTFTYTIVDDGAHEFPVGS
ncbi:MAG: cadherin-like domain-containing protein, partial [Pirellulales bacterium]|nr:cadherin-like domain-containing protein [Pirellulales bacterium]